MKSLTYAYASWPNILLTCAYFDLVLIDGSEFTGERDLWSVMGSKFIALDDVFAFKCWNAYQTLLHHSSYSLVCCDFNTRNGYAFFKRIF